MLKTLFPDQKEAEAKETYSDAESFVSVDDKDEPADKSCGSLFTGVFWNNLVDGNLGEIVGVKIVGVEIVGAISAQESLEGHFIASGVCIDQRK